MTTSDEVYQLQGPDAEATGLLMDEGFLVKAGSLARRELAPSANSVMAVHQRLVDERVLEVHGAQLRFLKDHLFKTPSSAAAAVIGRTANGWISWKRADGRTLAEVQRITRNGQGQILSHRKQQEILSRHQQLLNEGKLLTLQELDRQYALFRDRFGPAVLSGLDGEQLLALMHDHSNHDSLVYWLEFKNDEEFPTLRFGGIGGGSALKFRIFRSAKTGNWRAADKSNYPKDITIDEAIAFARCHRDQLLKGAELLEKLSDRASDEEYAELQDEMDEVAPDVSRLGWGHKYFSLLFPAKLDDYHSIDWQRFELLKLLQLPPERKGRYIGAGRFVTAANEVGLPMQHFTAMLGDIQGDPHRYWRIGATRNDSSTNHWPLMRDQSCVAVGWPDAGDLSWMQATKEARQQLKELLGEKYPSQHDAIGAMCSQLFWFVLGIVEGDIVVAIDGMTVLGVGRALGGYEFHSDSELPHRRQVEWLSVEEWRLPQPNEAQQSTVRELGKFNENLLAIEQHIQSPTPVKPPPIGDSVGPKLVRLSGVAGRIQSILDRKGQIVLYGPPGTGKTYWAQQTANDLAALSAFGKLFGSLDETQRATVLGHDGGSGLVRLCCFHPSYGYEDFMEGYRPRTINGQVCFELRDGIFKKLCKDAAASPGSKFYLIVDEINRGDIPRIFGELLTTLEKDKRGKYIVLPISQEAFSIPQNVFLLGTMNTADRSISLLDAALRRRFGFMELMPDSEVLRNAVIKELSLGGWLDALNQRIREHVGRDARNLQIGHSYLMQAASPLKDFATLKRAIRDDIVPLLEEYCYENYGTLSAILGEQLVDTAAQRIRDDLFVDGHEEELRQSLFASFPEISASAEALASDENESAVGGEEQEDES